MGHRVFPDGWQPYEYPLLTAMGTMLKQTLQSFLGPAPEKRATGSFNSQEDSDNKSVEAAANACAKNDVRVLHAGFVAKQSASTNKRSRRWAVLTSDGRLTYQHCNEKKRKTGRGQAVDLRKYNVCDKIVFYDQTTPLFTLYATAADNAVRTYVFFTPSEKEADQWIEAVKPFLAPPPPNTHRTGAGVVVPPDAVSAASLNGPRASLFASVSEESLHFTAGGDGAESGASTSTL